jgi:Mg/Co/Ni transporter MgtE
VAAVIARMAADDAADLIVELDQDRRGRVLALLPPRKRRQVEALLDYNPSTAGGMMSPDFVGVAPQESVARALEQVRASDLGAGTLTTVYLLDQERKLKGAAFIVTLLRAEPATAVEEVAEREPVWVGTDADLPEVARMMTDYNLVMLPVLDGEERMVGVVTVDDVLELTLPAGWRRRFGLVRD